MLFLLALAAVVAVFAGNNKGKNNKNKDMDVWTAVKEDWDCGAANEIQTSTGFSSDTECFEHCSADQNAVYTAHWSTVSWCKCYSTCDFQTFGKLARHHFNIIYKLETWELYQHNWSCGDGHVDKYAEMNTDLECIQKCAARPGVTHIGRNTARGCQCYFSCPDGGSSSSVDTNEIWRIADRTPFPSYTPTSMPTPPRHFPIVDDQGRTWNVVRFDWNCGSKSMLGPAEVSKTKAFPTDQECVDWCASKPDAHYTTHYDKVDSCRCHSTCGGRQAGFWGKTHRNVVWVLEGKSSMPTTAPSTSPTDVGYVAPSPGDLVAHTVWTYYGSNANCNDDYNTFWLDQSDTDLPGKDCTKYCDMATLGIALFAVRRYNKAYACTCFSGCQGDQATTKNDIYKKTEWSVDATNWDCDNHDSTNLVPGREGKTFETDAQCVEHCAMMPQTKFAAHWQINGQPGGPCQCWSSCEEGMTIPDTTSMGTKINANVVWTVQGRSYAHTFPPTRAPIYIPGDFKDQHGLMWTSENENWECDEAGMLAEDAFETTQECIDYCSLVSGALYAGHWLDTFNTCRCYDSCSSGHELLGEGVVQALWAFTTSSYHPTAIPTTKPTRAAPLDYEVDGILWSPFMTDYNCGTMSNFASDERSELARVPVETDQECLEYCTRNWPEAAYATNWYTFDCRCYSSCDGKPNATHENQVWSRLIQTSSPTLAPTDVEDYVEPSCEELTKMYKSNQTVLKDLCKNTKGCKLKKKSDSKSVCTSKRKTADCPDLTSQQECQAQAGCVPHINNKGKYKKCTNEFELDG